MMDLHAHSYFSDGSVSPRELVFLAQKSGLALCALTDHDCIDGVEEARQAGRELGVAVLSGLEMDIENDCEMHVLAYGFDTQNQELHALLNRQAAKRFERNEQILERLAELGAPVSVVRDERGVLVTRTHIAQALVAAGHAHDLTEAFAVYLGQDGNARIDFQRVGAEEYISLIHSAGGVCVLAHPGLLRSDWETATAWLAQCGLDGLEVYYAGHRANEIAVFRDLAKKYRLLMTAGSDFHGANRQSIYFGMIAELASFDPEVCECEQRLLELADKP